MKFKLILISTLMLTGSQLWAARGGISVGGYLGTAGASQTDINTVITTTGSSAGRLTSGLEFSGFWQYRFSSMFAMHLRTSYFTQSESGGANEYSMTGFTFFPMLRIYLLESKFVKFFTQVGVGWGFSNGEIKEGTGDVKFSGSNMGNSLGLGSEFCFGRGNHCVVVEGNVRFLPFDRNTVDSSSGTFSSGIDQFGAGQELELNGKDLGTTFSGIVGNIGYAYYF